MTVIAAMLPRFSSVRDVPGLLGGLPLYRRGHSSRDDHSRPVLWRSWAGLDSVSDPGVPGGGHHHHHQRNARRGASLVHTSNVLTLTQLAGLSLTLTDLLRLE